MYEHASEFEHTRGAEGEEETYKMNTQKKHCGHRAKPVSQHCTYRKAVTVWSVDNVTQSGEEQEYRVYAPRPCLECLDVASFQHILSAFPTVSERTCIDSQAPRLCPAIIPFE